MDMMYQKKKDGEKLKEYDFWNNTLPQFPKIQCECGFFMGVRDLNGYKTYCCEKCLNTKIVDDKDFENARHIRPTKEQR